MNTAIAKQVEGTDRTIGSRPLRQNIKIVRIDDHYTAVSDNTPSSYYQPEIVMTQNFERTAESAGIHPAILAEAISHGQVRVSGGSAPAINQNDVRLLAKWVAAGQPMTFFLWARGRR